MNLVGASQSSVEFGVFFEGSSMAGKYHDELRRYCPELGKGVLARLVERLVSRKAKDTAANTVQRGFCIGCGKDKSYHTRFPFCKQCYYRSDKGQNVTLLKTRVCHRCGKPNQTTLREPLCRECR